MTTRAAANNKMGKLYAGLSDIERARLLARLWREKNGAELDRLREAIPDDRAGKGYNQALAALRGLNSAFVVYQLIGLRTGFDRDYFAVHALTLGAHMEDAARDVLMSVSELFTYPMTQSERAAIVKRERATLFAVDDWADLIWGEEGLRPELQALMTEFYEPYTHTEMSKEERLDIERRYTARVVEEVRAAIARGELPKPRKAPQDATIHADADTLWLPHGALTDWATGTTEATYPVTAGDAAPILGFFTWSSMPCEVFPDNDAERVRAKRAKLRDVLLRIARYDLHIPQDKLDKLSVEPARSEREWTRASDYEAKLWQASDDHMTKPEPFRAVMQTFAERQATLRVLTDIIETLQAEIFGGEDPLDTRARELLDSAREAAKQAGDALSVYRKLPTDSAEPWPEPDNEAVYAHLRPLYERHIRAGAPE